MMDTTCLIFCSQTTYILILKEVTGLGGTQQKEGGVVHLFRI